MAEARGRFLFEIRPDICPEGYLTDLETALWERFYEYREQQRSANNNGHRAVRR